MNLPSSNGRTRARVLWTGLLTAALTLTLPQVLTEAANAATPPASGDIFISDTFHNRVVRVPADGGAQTEVGTGFSGPSGLVADAAGDLLIAEVQSNRVTRVPADGGAPTTVGTGLTTPYGVGVDAEGNVFIADSGNSRVVRVPADGGAQTTVGTGLNFPTGVAIDVAGNVFIADSNNDRVVRVPADGGAQTTVGTGLDRPWGLAVDTAGNVYIADGGNDRVVRVPADAGPQTTLATGFDTVYGLALDAAGNVLVADRGSHKVTRLPAGGGAETTVGTGLAAPQGAAAYAPAPTFLASSPATSATVGASYSYQYTASTPAHQPAARFRLTSGTLPTGLTLDPATGLLSGTPTANGSFTFRVQTENALNATVDDAVTIVVVLPPPVSGDIFISDTGHGRALRVPAGGGGQFVIATGIAYAAGNAVAANGDLLVADPVADKVLRLPADGGPQTTVGTGLLDPYGVAVDASGDVLIADASHDRVVRVPAGGGAQTTVGTGLDYPNGVAVDALGNVFIADTSHSRVVRVPADGGAQTTVGTSLLGPTGVAVDTAGNVLIADAGRDRVVLVPAGGGAQTTVGTGLFSPYAAVFDAAGDVLIADTVNHRVLRVPAGGGAPTTAGTSLAAPNGVAVYAPAPTFVASSPPTAATEGTSYSYTYTASTPAGQPAARFRLVSGTLPPGLTLNPATGVLTGTPTATGSFTFRVQTENAANATLDDEVTIVVQESKVSQSVIFTSSPPAHAKVGDSYDPTATGGTSGNPVVLTVIPASAGVCTMAAGVVRFDHVGTCVVRADQAGNASHWPASATQSIQVGKGPQSIVFTSTPPASPHPGETYTPTAHGGGSGLPVVLAIAPSSSGVCSISGGVVAFDAPGACVLHADQAGNADYEPATRVSQAIEVKRPPTVVDPQLTAEIVSALPTRRGWYRTPVTVSFDCTRGSGDLVDGCPDPVILNANGPDQQVTRTIISVDGGRASVTVSGIHIDQRLPGVRVKGVTNGGTYAHVRTIRCQAQDRHSGIHKCVVKTQRHRQADGDVVVRYRVKATDIAGNKRIRRGHYTIDR